jgi:glycogen phosphorylase
LTLGFARRFATYKRPNLLLHDPERLLRLLSNPQRPVQLIIAGKAHPADQAGQALIQKWIQFIRQPEVRPHAIFLSDYDMQLTERLVQGVDVWLNTPRRPWEACGTSGMKVLVNGGINLSELDGWWAEAYAPDWVGPWGMVRSMAMIRPGTPPKPGALRAARTGGDPGVLCPRRSGHSHGLGGADAGKHGAVDSALLRRPRGARIHRTTLSPGCRRLHSRTANKGAIGRQMVDWRHSLEQKWAALRFGEMKVETKGRAACL